MITRTRRGRDWDWVWLSFLMAYALTLADVSFAQDKVPLQKKTVRQVVEQIVPAIKSQNQNVFLNASMPLFESLKPDELEAVDDLCREHGVTPARQWFTELVLSNYHQGIAPSRVTSDLNMAKVTLNGVIERLTEFEELTAEHFVMQDPLEVPADFQESEEFFWELHVLHNEFENASRDLGFARVLVSMHEKKLRRKDEGKTYTEQLTAIEERVQKMYEVIEERAADLRLERFETAHKTLTEPSNKGDFELMLTSSMALEQDGQVLIGFLTDNNSIVSQSLTEPGLLERVNEMLVSGRDAAGDVATKANLFRNGLHYWVRGRFGAGPIAAGLVKSPNSIDSPQAMEALFMPKIRNKPISNFLSDEESIPGFDRRHFVTWGAEYRPATIVGGTSERTESESKVTSVRRGGSVQSQQFL